MTAAEIPKLRRGNWAVIALGVIVAALVGLLIAVVLTGQRARAVQVATSRAQTAQAIDAREASTRRIDLLQQQIAALQDEAAARSVELGTLRQRIADLTGRTYAPGVSVQPTPAQ